MGFNVYVLARPNDVPFYVGKGKKRKNKEQRVLDHEHEARKGHKCHKCNIIRKIWRDGGEVQRYIVFTTDDESEAFAYEIALIELYGRANLANLTDGGEGTSGAVLPANTRAKHSAIRTAKWQDAAYREKMLAHLETRRNDPAFRAKMQAIGAASSTSEQRSARTKALWTDPEYRTKVSARIRASQSDTARAKRSDDLKSRWNDPEQRAKLQAGIDALWSNPEQHAKRGAQAKAKWADPEHRAKMRAIALDREAKKRAAKKGT
jgi:hypothetical protein